MKESIAWSESPLGYTRISRSDIYTFMTADFFEAYGLWYRIKQYGWPHGKGYAAETALVFDIVELFDRELRAFERFKRGSDGNN